MTSRCSVELVQKAITCGLPALVTPYLGISSGIGQAGEHYQLVDRNQQTIAAAFSDLLQSPQQRDELGSKGRDYVVENVDHEHSLDHYAQLYEELGAAALKRR